MLGRREKPGKSPTNVAQGLGRRRTDDAVEDGKMNFEKREVREDAVTAHCAQLLCAVAASHSISMFPYTQSVAVLLLLVLFRKSFWWVWYERGRNLDELVSKVRHQQERRRVMRRTCIKELAASDADAEEYFIFCRVDEEYVGRVGSFDPLERVVEDLVLRAHRLRCDDLACVHSMREAEVGHVIRGELDVRKLEVKRRNSYLKLGARSSIAASCDCNRWWDVSRPTELVSR